MIYTQSNFKTIFFEVKLGRNRCDMKFDETKMDHDKESNT